MTSEQVCSSSSSSSSSFFRYNNTLCACNPGFIYNITTQTCSLFRVTSQDWFNVDSGVQYSLTFPETVFSFDSIKKFTQSQAVFLEATAILLLAWLIFCFLLRFADLGDGRNKWFKIRCWIARLDITFATRHWLDDQKPLMKRKTELGGTFSIASWILFIGLLAALLYQIISKRAIEVHNVRATSAMDLANFVNDMEFNITTISSMSCSNLRAPNMFVTGSPGFIDRRIVPLSTFVNYSCINTTSGPTITLKCSSCHLLRDNAYVSWQFYDLPSQPASAVGFRFKFSAKNRGRKKQHLSFVSGTLKNGSNLDDEAITFRGRDPNILKFNIFPRIYRNRHDLKLIQPLFQEFLPGSYFSNANQLRASLQKPNDGLINTTLYINFLTAYIVEIDDQNIMGPVSFLADLGGLYCISICIFLYFLVQCEYRIKKFRNEDSVMRTIKERQKAREHWDKLRKYVTYTWGCRTLLDEKYENLSKDAACCSGILIDPFHGKDSSSRRRKNQNPIISYGKNVNIQSKKGTITEMPSGADVPSTLVSGNMENNGHVRSEVEDDFDAMLPLSPPILEGAEMSVEEMEKNIDKLFEYNLMLSQKLVKAQLMLRTMKAQNHQS